VKLLKNLRLEIYGIGFKIIKICSNSLVWWMAYSIALLFGLQQEVHADSTILKIGSVILLPFVWIGQHFKMNEELAIEAMAQLEGV
jgi:hypothetical protein